VSQIKLTFTFMFSIILNAAGVTLCRNWDRMGIRIWIFLISCDDSPKIDRHSLNSRNKYDSYKRSRDRSRATYDSYRRSRDGTRKTHEVTSKDAILYHIVYQQVTRRSQDRYTTSYYEYDAFVRGYEGVMWPSPPGGIQPTANRSFWLFILFTQKSMLKVMTFYNGIVNVHIKMETYHMQHLTGYMYLSKLDSLELLATWRI
jgi:hypothetical protein